MSDKKCCVPGCAVNKGSHKTLHQFPNPVTDAVRFRTWIYAVGGDILKLKNEYIYKYRRVCHAHFEEKFCCRFNKISNIATPTLHMPDKGILPKECQETADLLLFVDSLFDSVNGSFANKKRHSKPLLGPVTPNSIHHKSWFEAKKVLKSMAFINHVWENWTQ